MLVRMIAAALTDAPLGAPSVVDFTGVTSTANRGRTAGIIFKPDNYYSVYRNGVPIDESTQWVTPYADANEYEIKATVLSGDTPTGTIGSWEPLGVTQDWTHATSTPSATLSCVLQIEIRWTGNNVVQDTANFTITANGP